MPGTNVGALCWYRRPGSPETAMGSVEGFGKDGVRLQSADGTTVRVRWANIEQIATALSDFKPPAKGAPAGTGRAHEVVHHPAPTSWWPGRATKEILDHFDRLPEEPGARTAAKAPQQPDALGVPANPAGVLVRRRGL